ncbi:hypothetical protein, partial [Brevibacillus borstelensis]|uniref:hypothetical protein n=1 Tax=Brevibacillus borstelensis TaxID=45462 RepID=UPI001C3FAF29
INQAIHFGWLFAFTRIFMDGSRVSLPQQMSWPPNSTGRAGSYLYLSGFLFVNRGAYLCTAMDICLFFAISGSPVESFQNCQRLVF